MELQYLFVSDQVRGLFLEVDLVLSAPALILYVDCANQTTTMVVGLLHIYCDLPAIAPLLRNLLANRHAMHIQKVSSVSVLVQQNDNMDNKKRNILLFYE